LLRSSPPNSSEVPAKDGVTVFQTINYNTKVRLSRTSENYITYLSDLM
jgi:hypothetical protein